MGVRSWIVIGRPDTVVTRDHCASGMSRVNGVVDSCLGQWRQPTR
jgi:hypothetical protein